LHKIDEDNCPRTRNFVVIICVNVAKSIHNKRLYLNKQDYVVQDIDADTADTGNDPLDILVDKDSVNQIIKAIESLNPIYRDILLLKQAYGYSRKEIAELLETPEETVKKRLSRARAMLAQVLEKEEVK
jgi:RNA polymerase sigma factor (sigma-70 family)